MLTHFFKGGGIPYDCVSATTVHFKTCRLRLLKKVFKPYDGTGLRTGNCQAHGDQHYDSSIPQSWHHPVLPAAMEL